MVDYSKLSDFEINLRVAELVVDYEFISRLPYVGMAVQWGDGANWHSFNPCNNPADAWPIIEKNKIGVRNISGDLWECSSPDGMKADHSSRPLHSSMVVFLMMQDEKHG